MIRRLFLIIPGLAMLLVEARQARADIINPSFETGDLTGWTAVLDGGTASVVTTHAAGNGVDTFLPTDGSYFALVTAGSEDIYQLLSQATFILAGSTVEFDVFFDGHEWGLGGFDDGAYALIRDSGGGETSLFGATIFGFGASDGSTDTNNTGWVHVAYVVPASDTYTLEFGVRNAGDSGFSSDMGIDNVIVPAAAVPEPGSMTLLGIGIVVVCGYRWRRNRRQ